MSTVPSQISKYMGNAVKLADIWGSVLYNVKASPYRAEGDGTEDDTASIAAAITAASEEGGIVMLPPGTFKTGNQTVPANVTLWFANGAMISVNSGATVTINGPIEAGLYQIFSGSGTISGSIKNEVVYPQWWGAKLDAVTDDTSALQKALTAHYKVFVTVGNLRITSTVNLKAFQNLGGEGEGSNIYADFTGGPAVRYVGGEPIVIRDLKIMRNPAIIAVEGDNGLEIGLTTAWAGRGEISNLLIALHYDGFKWKGGTTNTIRNIKSIQNKNHGFHGVNPRGELTECLVSDNYGDGFYIYSETGGETGIQLTNCGTFANQGYGLRLDSAPGIGGANIYATNFSSSFDGRGGIYCNQPYIQLNFTRTFVEYSGFATNFHPEFTTYNDSKGIFLNNSGINKCTFTQIQVLHCKGTGVHLVGTTDVIFDGLFCHDNGIGALGGANQQGIRLESNIRLMMNNFSTGLESVNQVTDLVVADANNTGLLSNGYVYSVAAVQQTGLTISSVITRGSATTAASASSLQLPLTHDFILVTGTTAIDAISPSYKGRRITLKFESVLSVSDGNNLKLSSVFNTTADDTLTLVYDGSFWYEVSRSVN